MTTSEPGPRERQEQGASRADDAPVAAAPDAAARDGGARDADVRGTGVGGAEKPGAEEPGGTPGAEGPSAERPGAEGPQEAGGLPEPRRPDEPQPVAEAESGASVGGVPDPEEQVAVPEREPSPDRVFRSGGGMAGGVLLLALVAWLGIDALVSGQGRTPWLALATMLLLVPLVTAYTLRPAVYANEERLRVRNPFRVITLPWNTVSALRSGYSNEVVDRAGAKYQLWALPVSLRARKKAGREQVRASSAESPGGRGGVFGGGRSRGLAGAFGGVQAPSRTRPGDQDPMRARTDRTMDDLRELAERRAEDPAAQGEAEVHWSYEVLAPALAGLVLLVVLLAVG